MDASSSDAGLALAQARERLLAARGPDGIWRGYLSSSALSTAVAVFALSRMDAEAYRTQVTRGLRWLASHANADGGWGDTPDSPSNLSTTLLVWSALNVAGTGELPVVVVSAAEAWIARRAGGVEPDAIARAVLEAYGNDRTFSAPILTVCALAGRLGDAPWRHVPQLPFELSVLPHGVFRFLRLSVVSYAIPALIAIGLVRHRAGTRGGTLVARLRDALTGPALRVLRRCQPKHGGFLEAAPLNGFVAVSLAAAGLGDHPVARGCAGFLAATVRPDGSWPIDTDLATWLTTLSINALGADPLESLPFTAAEQATLRQWVAGRPFRAIHPYTRAEPGGWGWTDLPGAVPDADDTAGALLALHRLGGHDPDSRRVAAGGLVWLLDLQNSDGGIPTFCRGWGRLPFDRSCPDITAHAMQAYDAWYRHVDARLRRRLDEGLHAGLQYLQGAQRSDGSWIPLWFGNQQARGQENPTYGTAQVVRSLNRLTQGCLPKPHALVLRGIRWLTAAQNDDGGWGGDAGVPSTVEETALAVSALAGTGEEVCLRRGVEWLAGHTRGGTGFVAAPIGLYFARLWYSERLYPLIHTVHALAAVGGGGLPSGHGPEGG